MHLRLVLSLCYKVAIVKAVMPFCPESAKESALGLREKGASLMVSWKDPLILLCSSANPTMSSLMLSGMEPIYS